MNTPLMECSLTRLTASSHHTGAVEDFVVEHRKVEREAEADGVRWGKREVGHLEKKNDDDDDDVLMV